MSKIKELDADNFDDFTSSGKVVVDFYADWCGPCKMMAPEFENAAKENTSIKFGKLNVEEAQQVASKFRILSIPTTIFFDKGEMVERHTGYMTGEELTDTIKEVF